jgi:hypothetical protein
MTTKNTICSVVEKLCSFRDGTNVFLFNVFLAILIVTPIMNGLFKELPLGKQVQDMYREYYAGPMRFQTLFLDVVFIMFYAWVIFELFKVLKPWFFLKGWNTSLSLLLVAVVVIVLIDLLFAGVAGYMPNNTVGGFLGKWGKTLGFGAILYDIVYISLIIFLALAINKLNEYYTTNKVLIPAVLLIYIYIVLGAKM